MAQPGPETDEVNARIVYWGIPGAGVSASLHRIHAKLRADHRAELQKVPTRLDPTVSYELLPIELGVVSGKRTRLQIVAVPAEAEHAPTRKQLLDRIDGVVLVIDCQRARIQENLAFCHELREALASYGRSLDDVPTVIQYNKSDLGDPGVVEELHRGLGLSDAAAFETVAADGSGVLQVLTTISKRVARVMRDRTPEQPPEAPVSVPTEPAPEQASTRIASEAEPEASASQADASAQRTAIGRLQLAPAKDTVPTAPPAAIAEPRSPSPPAAPSGADPEVRRAVDPHDPGLEPPASARTNSALDLMEKAILAEGERVDEEIAETTFEAQTLLDCSWDQIDERMKSAGEARIGADLRIVSVGTAKRTGDRVVRVPLVLGNADGESVTLALTIQLDPILDGEEA